MTRTSSIFENSSHLSRSEMLDYIDGKLTGTELHRIEHHLTDCEFCSEAVEGLIHIGAAEAKSILEKTDEAVHKMIQPKNETVTLIRRWMTMAAVFLTLVVASFVLNYYLHQKNKQIVQDIKPLTVTTLQPPDSPQESEATEISSANEGSTVIESPPPPEDKKKDANMTTPGKESTTESFFESSSITSVAAEQGNLSVTGSIPKSKDSEEEQTVSEETLQDTKTKNIPPVPPNTIYRQENLPVSSEMKPESDVNPKMTKGKKTGIDYFNENNFSTALKNFAEQYKEDNNNLEAAYYAGVCAVQLKEYSQAIGYFDAVLANPSHPYYLKAEWQKSLALIAQGNKPAAEVLLNKIIAEGKEYKDSANVKLLHLK